MRVLRAYSRTRWQGRRANNNPHSVGRMQMHVAGAGAACTDAFEPTNDAREAQAYQQNMASPRIGRDSWMKSEQSWVCKRATCSWGVSHPSGAKDA
jgi:hypothetical protein